MQFKPFTIGRYEFLEAVSSGGMGRVYKARLRGDGQFSKIVAIKQLLKEPSGASTLNQRFEREAVISVQLSHPNIVQTLDYFLHEGQCYIVMEFMEGSTLRDLFAQISKLEDLEKLRFACYVISQIAEGLFYAYKFKNTEGKSLEIIHRDVTPHNMMVSSNGEVKLFDFGVAKAKQFDVLTASGQIIGKSGYFAPELFEGVEGSHLGDLYSLGVVFHELLTGKKLFSGTNELVVLRKQSEMVIPIPSTDNRKVPTQIDHLVLKLLNPDPKKRFENAGRLSQSLKKFLSEEFPDFSNKKFIEIIHKLVPNAPVQNFSIESSSAHSLAKETPPDLPIESKERTIFPELDLERFYETKVKKLRILPFLSTTLVAIIFLALSGQYLESQKEHLKSIGVADSTQLKVTSRDLASNPAPTALESKMNTQVNLFIEKKFTGLLGVEWELVGEAGSGVSNLECGRKQKGVCDLLEFEHSGKNQIRIKIRLSPEQESVYQIESCKVVGGTDHSSGNSCELLIMPTQYVEAWLKILEK